MISTTCEMTWRRLVEDVVETTTNEAGGSRTRSMTGDGRSTRVQTTSSVPPSGQAWSGQSSVGRL